jgi:hypothetical protein
MTADPSAGAASRPAPAEAPTDDFADTIRLGEWDWWETTTGRSLHAAADIDIDGAYETAGEGRTFCGRTGWLSIPGLFTRMGAKRCGRCCDALGYPHGIGSPKNDAALRPLVEARIGGAA